MPNGSQRICCIGFQKTGTTSLAEALSRLGYSVTNINRDVDAKLEGGGADPQATAEEMAVAALHDTDVIQDSPAAFVYPALDKAYPGSKFILTHRPVDKWLASYGRFFRDKNNAIRRWMYGVDRFSGNEATYRAIYEAKHAEIRSYFADRPGDFLEMDLSAGAGWTELVDFLGPAVLPPFPHANSGPKVPPVGRAKRLIQRIAGD